MSVRSGVMAIAIGGAVALAACGSGQAPISSAARARLVPLVERVRQAAESRDRAATRRSLVALRAAVSTAQRNGDVSTDIAAEILAAATRVERRVSLLPAPTTTTTTTTTLPADTGSGAKKHNHGKGNQRNGKGDGGND